jgi:hypothetical protein
MDDPLVQKGSGGRGQGLVERRNCWYNSWGRDCVAVMSNLGLQSVM